MIVVNSSLLHHPKGRLMFVQSFNSLLLDSSDMEVTSCVVKLRLS